MTLRLYLDDCIYSRELRNLLRAAGHDVETPFDVRPSLAGAEDTAHFGYAKRANRILLTYDARDFLFLHKLDPTHPGILVIYQENDPRKDMSPAQIVAAIVNVESALDCLVGQFLALNHFRW